MSVRSLASLCARLAVHGRNDRQLDQRRVIASGHAVAKSAFDGDANERLKKILKLVIGFFAGCIAGAAAVSWLGDWAWLSAVILAGAAVVLW